MASPDKSKAIFDALSDTEENAAVVLFIALLRSSPLLLQWLRIFSLHPAIFERLAAVIERQLEPPKHARAGRKFLAWLACADDKGTPENIHAHEQEIAFLRQKAAPVELPSYGGLTARQVLALVRHYQSGRFHSSAFLLAHAWREARSALAPHGTRPSACAANSASSRAFSNATNPADATANPADKHPHPRLPLLHATLLFLQDALGHDRPWLLHHLAISAHFFHTHAPGTVGQAHFGHTGWWKLHLLHYMIHHPKHAYRLGEFASLLQARRLDIHPRMLRRFCTEHGIARDTAPGRPRQKLEKRAASKLRLAS